VWAGRSSILSPKLRVSLALAVSTEASSGNIGRLLGRRNDDFVAVAVDPAIVFRITPGCVRVHARRNFACLAILLMPGRARGGNEALVHRRVLRIGQTIGHRPLALNPNSHTKEAVGAAVAPKIRRSRRKTAVAQPVGDL